MIAAPADENSKHGLNFTIFHSIVAALLFSPIFFGKFAVAGTDLIYNHYPNLLFGYREFQDFGKLSLWNPYIFSGINFSASMQAHYLNPLYWPLFALPEQYLFHGLTVYFMVFNASIGLVWTNIASHLGVRTGAVLLIGIVAQASMFFWFAMTTMISVPMYLAASVAIWLVLTYANRNWLKNYIALSIAFAVLFITPHPMYILGFTLPVAIFFAFHHFPHWILRPWGGAALVFMLALITALAFAAYRLVPVAAELTTNGNVLKGSKAFVDVVNAGYFGLTIVNPLTLGISLSDSLSVAKALQMLGGRHAQMHNGLYFGVVPLVIVYFALRLRPDAKLLALAATYGALQFSYLHAFLPLTDLVYFIAHPFAHEGLFRPATAFSFLFLLVAASNRIQSLSGKRFIPLAGEAMAIGILAMTAWVAMFARIANGAQFPFANIGVGTFNMAAKATVLGGLALVVAVVPATRRWLLHPHFGKFALLLCLLMLLFAGSVLYRYGVLLAAEVIVRPLLHGLIVIFVCLVVIELSSVQKSLALAKYFFVTLVIAVVLIALPHDLMFGTGFGYIAWVGTVGWASFLALLAAALVSFAKLGEGGIDRGRIIVLLVLLTGVDLVVSYKNYTYVNVNDAPFNQTQSLLYPRSTLADVETESPAVNAQGNLLQNPGFEIVKGMPSSWTFGGHGLKLCPLPEPLLLIDGGAIKLCASSADGSSNLFLDVPLAAKASEASFGVWVRAKAPMEVKVFLTSPPNRSGGNSSHYIGDGKWRWVVARISFNGPLKAVRPHLNMAKAGEAEFFAPKLVLGSDVYPERTPYGVGEIAGIVDEILPSSLADIDLDNFRANRIHMINRVAAGELMTNFAIVARTPTYAGVDSDLSSDFIHFLANFKILDSAWFSRAGFLASIEDERALDLLGVRYDIDPNTSRIIERPNAISRFAAFSVFEVMPDFNSTLARLKSPSFDLTTTLMLDKAPESAVIGAQSTNWQLLRYERLSADQVRLDIASETPRIVLFNDRYSVYWNATWNGESLSLLRANGIFMAVVLPNGPGTLLFTFRPELFYRLVYLAFGVAIFLTVLTAFTYLPPLFRKWSNSASRKARLPSPSV
jgi:hypothetical protein